MLGTSARETERTRWGGSATAGGGPFERVPTVRYGRDGSETQPIPNRVDDALLLVLCLLRIGNDLVGDEDDDPVVIAVLDRDEAVPLQRRQRVLDVVDVGVDGGAHLEDCHSVARTIDECVEYRHFDVTPVSELAPRSHTQTLIPMGYTLTAGRGEKSDEERRPRRPGTGASAVRLTQEVHFWR